MSGGLAAAQDVLQTILRGRIGRRYASQSAHEQDTLERGRTADAKVASGEWTTEQAESYRRGKNLEPTTQQKLSGLYGQMDKAPNYGEIPTEESAAQEFKTKKIPVRYGPMEVPGTNVNTGQAGTEISGNLPSRQSGPITPEWNEFRQAREAKMNSFPATAEDYVDGSGLKRRRYVNPRPDNQMNRDFATEPTPQQAGANKQAELLGGELSQPVIAQRASQAGQEAEARTQGQQRAEIAASGLTSQQQSAALSLSDNFTNESKGFYVVEGQIHQMVSLGKDHTPASDLGMIFAFNKILDSMGSVREGEQERVAAATGLMDRIGQFIERLKSGTILPDHLRNDLLTQSRKMYEAASIDQKRRIDDYSQRAAMMRIDPRLVTRKVAEDLQGGEGSESALDRVRSGKAYR